MSKPTIFRKPQGPIVVRGEINLTDPEGNPIEHGTRFLCVDAVYRRTCLFVMAPIRSLALPII